MYDTQHDSNWDMSNFTMDDYHEMIRELILEASAYNWEHAFDAEVL